MFKKILKTLGGLIILLLVVGMIAYFINKDEYDLEHKVKSSVSEVIDNQNYESLLKLDEVVKNLSEDEKKVVITVWSGKFKKFNEKTIEQVFDELTDMVIKEDIRRKSVAAENGFSNYDDYIKDKKEKEEKKALLAKQESEAKALAIAEEEQRNRPISVTDLMVDYNQYLGSYVRVKGFLLAGGGMLNILYTQPGATSGVFLNFDSLDRDSHKKALQHCSSGCTNVVIEGYVTDINYNKGIKVSAIKDK